MNYPTRYFSFLSPSCPNNLKKKNFAKAGFHYTNDGDTVMCGICRVRIRDWRDFDNPIKQHEKFSPHCLYVKFMKDKYVKEALKQPAYKLDTVYKVYSYMHTAKFFYRTRFFSALKNEHREDFHTSWCTSNTCKVCLLEHACIVLLPCRHFCLCDSCSERCADCPLCRSHVDCKLKVFT